MAKELATKEQAQTPAAVEIVGTTLDDVERALATGAEINIAVVDPEQSAQAITLRILTAETDEQAFTPSGTVNGRSLVGVPLEIQPPLRAFDSQFEGEGPSFFVVFNAVRMDTGEAIAVSTSARNVLAALVNGVRRGRFPERKMMFWEPERPTRAGYMPLWLVKTDYTPEQASA